VRLGVRRPAGLRAAISSTGPAYEAFERVGAAGFDELARARTSENVRDGLPLRAIIELVGFIATRP
jgi:hypothetical protein